MKTSASTVLFLTGSLLLSLNESTAQLATNTSILPSVEGRLNWLQAKRHGFPLSILGAEYLTTNRYCCFLVETNGTIGFDSRADQGSSPLVSLSHADGVVSITTFLAPAHWPEVQTNRILGDGLESMFQRPLEDIVITNRVLDFPSSSQFEIVSDAQKSVMGSPKIPLGLVRRRSMGQEEVAVSFLYSVVSDNIERCKAKLKEEGLFASGVLRLDDRGHIHVEDKDRAVWTIVMRKLGDWVEMDDDGHLYDARGGLSMLRERTVHLCAKTQLSYTNKVGQEFEVTVWNAKRLNGLPSRVQIHLDGQLTADWSFAYPVLVEYGVKNEASIALFVGPDGKPTFANFGVKAREINRGVVSVGELRVDKVKSLVHRFLDMTEPIELVSTNAYRVWELPADRRSLFGLAGTPSMGQFAGYKRSQDPVSLFFPSNNARDMVESNLGRMPEKAKAQTMRAVDAALQVVPEFTQRMMAATNTQQEAQIARELTEKVIMSNPNLSERQKKKMLERVRKEWEKQDHSGR